MLRFFDKKEETMNKQEAMDAINGLETYTVSDFMGKGTHVLKYSVLDIVSDIDEPQKVVIPQYVAEHIEYLKSICSPLSDVFNRNFIDDDRITKWLLNSPEANDRLGRAWLDGYEIERARLYMIEITGISPGKNILNYDKDNNIYFFESQTETENCRTKFTQKELEDAGFSWLFERGFAKEVEK